MSVQADDEEIQDLEMHISAYERDELDSEINGPSISSKTKKFSSKRSTTKTNKSIVTITALNFNKKERES